MSLNKAYLCIGGNLGDREENLEETREFISFNMGDIIAESSIYQSPAWGMEGAPDFLNQVLLIETKLSLPLLLAEITELEVEFYGRKKTTGTYSSREMDVDILFYNDEILESEKLTVPHPRMHLRKFVLVFVSSNIYLVFLSILSLISNKIGFNICSSSESNKLINVNPFLFRLNL
jgi:2-amino-4-hydroxy-6-hydroxymethyldihydropteridine diphosphokinase